MIIESCPKGRKIMEFTSVHLHLFDSYQVHVSAIVPDAILLLPPPVPDLRLYADVGVLFAEDRCGIPDSKGSL
jgi:hypothetical protein